MSENSATFRFPSSEFRSLPFPITDSGKRAKVANCFVRATEIPAELCEWLEVNPRIPKRSKEKLSGPVAKAIINTLTDAPDKFAYKNLGIWLLVDSVDFERPEGGGDGAVIVKLSDKQCHGIVNGG